jgi:hypothetical protein
VNPTASYDADESVLASVPLGNELLRDPPHFGFLGIRRADLAGTLGIVFRDSDGAAVKNAMQ